MEQIRLVLASASPRRKELLEQIGMTPVICPSAVEEVITRTVPAEVVEELAAQKCRDVAGARKEDCFVLGADTVVACEGKILGKPKDVAEACAMLAMLAGRTHEVYTGVDLIHIRKGRILSEKNFSVETKVTVFPMTEEEIRAYVATGDPMDKAGAYGIQGIFAKHVEKIEGDYNNVVGLPVSAVYQTLRRMAETERTVQ